MNINIENINFISVESVSSNHHVVPNRYSSLYSNVLRRFFTEETSPDTTAVLPEEIQISFSTSSPFVAMSNTSVVPLSLQDLSQNTQLLLYQSDNHSESLCSICRIPIQNQEICRKVNRCLHLFHSSCIDSWLIRQDTCPLCRCSIRQ